MPTVRYFPLSAATHSHVCLKGGGQSSVTCLSFMGPLVVIAHGQTVKTHSNEWFLAFSTLPHDSNYNPWRSLMQEALSGRKINKTN